MPLLHQGAGTAPKNIGNTPACGGEPVRLVIMWFDVGMQGSCRAGSYVFFVV